MRHPQTFFFVFAFFSVSLSFVASVSRAAATPSTGIQCVVDVCGPGQAVVDRLSIEQKQDLRTPAVQTWMTTAVDPIIDQLISALMVNQKIKAKSLPLLLERIDKENLSVPEQAILIRQILNTSLFSDRYSEATDFGYSGEIEVVKDKFASAFADLSPAGRAILLRTAIALFSSEKVQLALAMSVPVNQDIFLLTLKSAANPRPTIQTTAVELLRWITKMRAVLGPSFVDARDYKMLSVAAQSGRVPPEKLTSFETLYVSLLSETAGAEAIVKAAHGHRLLPSSSDLKRLLHVNEIKTSLPQVNLQTANLKQRFRHAVETVLLSAPTSEELAATQKLIEQIRAQAIAVVEKNLVTASARETAARNKLASVQFALPTNRLIMADELVERLKSDLDYAASYQAEAQTEMAAGGRWVTLLYRDLAYLDIDTLNQPLGNIDSEIRAYHPGDLTDASYDNGQILVSWQTVKLPAYGAGVIAHEMGHIAALDLNENSGWTYLLTAHGLKDGAIPAMLCTVAKHDLIEEQKGIDNQTQEDWADTFSIRIRQRMGGFTKGLKNEACFFQDANSDTNAYLEPSLKDVKGDPHSSAFYRLLQIQAGLGQLPRSCAAAVPTGISAKLLRPCLK